MEILKSLDTIKAVCDDAVANSRFRNMQEVSKVMDAFDSIVGFINKQAEIIKKMQLKNESQDLQPKSPEISSETKNEGVPTQTFENNSQE